MSVILFSTPEWITHLPAIHWALLKRSGFGGTPCTERAAAFLENVNEIVKLNTACHASQYSDPTTPVEITTGELLNAWRKPLHHQKALSKAVRFISALNYNCHGGEVEPNAEEMGILFSWQQACYEALVNMLSPEDEDWHY